MAYGAIRVIYNATNFLTIPFRGIFPNVAKGRSDFDVAALLAIVMYYLVIVLIDRIFSLFSKRTDS